MGNHDDTAQVFLVSEHMTPLHTGPPTRAEMLLYYPPKFTWEQLRMFLNFGDLRLLRRHKKLEERYHAWAKGTRAQYGSMVNYLIDHRLQWGKPDRLSLYRSALDTGMESTSDGTITMDKPVHTSGSGLPPIPLGSPSYFTADTPSELISIIMNDWPYSVPLDVEHVLIWTRLPILPPPPAGLELDPIPQSVRERLLDYGIWGYTGTSLPPPDPSLVPSHLYLFAEYTWGYTGTLEDIVPAPSATDEEEIVLAKTRREIERFITSRYVEKDWETAWFVNPGKTQSVPDLAHIHVFARKKAREKVAV